MGRLTRDPEVRYSQGEKPIAIARYTLAIDRRGRKSQDSNEQTADFINCVALDRAGEFAEKYYRQGMRVLISGRIQSGSHTSSPEPSNAAGDGFTNITDGVDNSGLPFN